MKQQKVSAQKVRNFSFGRCVICNKKARWSRNIETNEGAVFVTLCHDHALNSDIEILDVIYNNAEEMLK